MRKTVDPSGKRFAVRYHTRHGFHTGAAAPAQAGTDADGRAYRDECG